MNNERLTKRNENGDARYAKPITGNSCREIDECAADRNGEVLRRLCELEDMLDDGELDIEMYLRSFEEGDNITVTCDLLNAMDQAVLVFNSQKAEIERLTKNKELTERNAKLEKVIDWLNKRIGFNFIERYGRRLLDLEHTGYAERFYITEEEYELLREVLHNDK